MDLVRRLKIEVACQKVRHALSKFEARHQDRRPRQAIEAADAWLRDQTAEKFSAVVAASLEAAMAHVETLNDIAAAAAHVALAIRRIEEGDEGEVDCLLSMIEQEIGEPSTAAGKGVSSGSSGWVDPDPDRIYP